MDGSQSISLSPQLSRSTRCVRAPLFATSALTGEGDIGESPQIHCIGRLASAFCVVSALGLEKQGLR